MFIYYPILSNIEYLTMSNKLILLINTGTPSAPEPAVVGAYLREFLMDKNVISLPYPIRYLLVNGIIVPFRTKHSTEKYKTIFEDGVSPLLRHTEQLTTELQQLTDTPIVYGMRYGRPNAIEVVKEIAIKHKEIEEVVLVPLFPHKTKSSFITSTTHFEQQFQHFLPHVRVKTIAPFFAHPLYINALKRQVETSLTSRPDKFVFSFHGIPIQHLYEHHSDKKFVEKRGECCANTPATQQECYQYQCYMNANELAKSMHLAQEDWEIMFQSRLGRQQWLQPYTAERLAQLPQEGVKSIAIIVPSFLTDCLETLEEIAMEGKEIFLNAGGESYQYIPCLNTAEEWVRDFWSIINEA